MVNIWLPSFVNNSSETWRLKYVIATSFFLLKPSFVGSQFQAILSSSLYFIVLFEPFPLSLHFGYSGSSQTSFIPESPWDLTVTETPNHPCPCLSFSFHWNRIEHWNLIKFLGDSDFADPGRTLRKILDYKTPGWTAILDRSDECNDSLQEKQVISKQCLQILTLIPLRKFWSSLDYWFSISLCGHGKPESSPLTNIGGDTSLLPLLSQNIFNS